VQALGPPAQAKHSGSTSVGLDFTWLKITTEINGDKEELKIRQRDCSKKELTMRLLEVGAYVGRMVRGALNG
jgi:hypothetical protein